MIDTIPTFEEVPESTVILSVDDLESVIPQDTQEEETEEVSEEETIEESTEQTDEEVAEESAPIVEGDPLAVTVYESLVEKGLFEKDDNFDGSFEAIDEKLGELPSKLLKQAIDELPEYSQQLLKYIATAGQNLVKEELDDFIRKFIGESEQVDVSNLDSAREYLEKHLTEQGLRRNAIQAQLDDLEDSDELISEAERILKSKEKETDKLIQSKEQENRQIQESQKEFFSSVQTALQETKWSKPQQDKVLQTIPKTNEILQNVIKNPSAYVQMIDFLSKFDGKKFNLESYLKQGESRANSSIREKLEKSGFSSASSKTSTSSEQPGKGSLEELLKTATFVV